MPVPQSVKDTADVKLERAKRLTDRLIKEGTRRALAKRYLEDLARDKARREMLEAGPPLWLLLPPLGILGVLGAGLGAAGSS
ncbi:MAG: hypothetical protein AAFR17_14640 [Pseudomonadota bacterium]